MVLELCLYWPAVLANARLTFTVRLRYYFIVYWKLYQLNQNIFTVFSQVLANGP
jgi:hypothetical protein